MENLQIAWWLFLVYSALGWVLETVVCAFRYQKFVNRGFLNGPICSIYGVAVLLMSVFLQDLQGNWLFLFIGCTVTATVVELLGGLALEYFGDGRWWDYSGRRFHLGGYICLESSLLWGILGVTCVTWFNPAAIWILQWLPDVMRIVLLVGTAVLYGIDLVGSYLAIAQIRKYPRIAEANERIDDLTQKLGRRLVARVIRRLEKAHPKSIGERKHKKKTVFAQGCGYQKLFMLMLIGSILGDAVETVYVWLTSGVWMSRSSLVWGQFSLVWGIALAGGTAMLYRHRHKSDGFLFWFGFFVGGAFEYFCSVFTELAFGTIFWDYSDYPFNLGGRINLLYCFFWGIAGVVWLKKMYPVFAGWIEKIPMKFGKWMVTVLTVFMALNMAVTCGAMNRYSERAEGIMAENVVEQWIDEVFPDEWMENRYQNMKFT